MSDAAWQSLFTNLPAILASLAALITAVFTALQAYRNGKKAEIAAVKADTAAANTETALTKTLEMHRQTQQLSEQAQQIAEQTDGQLSKILEENTRLHEAITQMASILSAREGNPSPVRGSDQPASAMMNGGKHVTAEPHDPAEERRRGERRREPSTE